MLQDIYILVSKLGFSGEYVERLSPMDRKMQLFYYEQELEEKKKKQRNVDNAGPSIGSGFDM